MARHKKSDKGIRYRCSYCRNTGHNRQTCIIIKDDRHIVHTENKRWRQEFLNKINEIGFGPGALIQAYSDTGNSIRPLVLVTGLQWQELTFVLATSRSMAMSFPVTGLSVVKGDEIDQFDLPVNFEEMISYASKIYCSTVVSISEKTFEPPEGWVDDTTDIDTIMNNVKARQSWLFENL